MPKISETTINAAVYEGATEYLGIAEVNLPDLAQLTTEVSGAGIAGKINSPIIGHIEPMSMTLNFRSVTEEAYKLSTPESHSLDLRVAQQERDSGTGKSGIQKIKYSIIATPVKLGMGKIAPASTSDASGEYSVTYLAVYIDGKKVTEVDPMNYIYIINGKDYLADVRKALGK